MTDAGSLGAYLARRERALDTLADWLARGRRTQCSAEGRCGHPCCRPTHTDPARALRPVPTSQAAPPPRDRTPLRLP